MRRSILTLLLLVSPMVAVAQTAKETGSFVGHFYNYVGETRYTSTVTTDALAATPVWRDDDRDPPLSPREAVAAARACLDRLELPVKAWEVESIALRPAGGDGHWIYNVTFNELTDEGSAGKLKTMSIVVLMNGEAVVPQVKPE